MKVNLKLVQFGAPTCMPCHAIKEKVVAWIKELENIGLEVEYQYLSVDQEPLKAAEAGVFTVPALKLYIDGKVAVEDAGYFSFEAFVDKATRYIELL